MLVWEKVDKACGCHWLAFDDGAPLFKVFKGDDGWCFDYLPEVGVEASGYDTAEAAMEAAEAAFQLWDEMIEELAAEIEAEWAAEWLEHLEAEDE
jgi:hypothetical protein